MNNEYVIWGKQQSNDFEEVLYTKATTLKEAQHWIKKVGAFYSIKDARIQVIDFATPVNFGLTLN